MTNRLEQFDIKMDKDRLRIPLDLSEWVNREVLLAWVREEIEAMDWGNPELVKYLQAHPDFRPKNLLTLLSYAYATGVLESEEIIAALRQRPEFKELRVDAEPRAREMERFRRENRGLLKYVLVQILKRALQRKWEL